MNNSPSRWDSKNGLASSYAKLATFHRDHQGNVTKALSYFQEAGRLWEELVEQAPAHAEFQQNLVWVREDITGLG